MPTTTRSWEGDDDRALVRFEDAKREANVGLSIHGRFPTPRLKATHLADPASLKSFRVTIFRERFLHEERLVGDHWQVGAEEDRKSTRLNSSH